MWIMINDDGVAPVMMSDDILFDYGHAKNTSSSRF